MFIVWHRSLVGVVVGLPDGAGFVIDGVLIATPVRTHYQLAKISLLALAKHVLV